MTVYYLDESPYWMHKIGTKARNDLMEIFKDLRFKPLSNNTNIESAFLSENDIIIFNYVLIEDWQYRILEYALSHNISTILIILDIISVRSENNEGIQNEIKFFNQFTHLVIQNEHMKKWLEIHNITVDMSKVELFDYLIKKDVFESIKSKCFSNKIVYEGDFNRCIRGGLDKREENHQYHLNLYGNRIGNKVNNENVSYRGDYDSEIIPTKLDGSFGLLWNEDCTKTNLILTDQYSIILTPHKLSLYLVSKLPVICFSHSCEAQFVIQNQIGFTIDSLAEIDNKLKKITNSEYQIMIKNVENIARKLIYGYQFKSTLLSITGKLNISKHFKTSLHSENEVKVTIFTPTYNRGYLLNRLYESLTIQSNKDFEWLIIDDGSTDNTLKLVNDWISKETNFEIKYVKISNGGKHRAINYGTEIARGKLFCIVDSDDYLVNTAIEQIIYWESTIADKGSFAGVAGNKGYDENTIIGGTFSEKYIDGTSLERQKLNIFGDKAEVFYTHLLRYYKFPEIDGENFMTENVVWNHIAFDGFRLRWFNEIIYIAQYGEDGLTYNMPAIVFHNPIGSRVAQQLNDIFFSIDEIQQRL